MQPRPTVFLDRDGTLMADHGFVGDPHAVELLPGVASGLHRLQSAGYRCVVVSNQSGVERGFFDLAAVRAVEAELTRQLAAFDVSLQEYFVCPHLASGCDCRKPLPGLLAAAQRVAPVMREKSVMVGDRGSDIAAGHAFGITSLLVVTGKLAYTGPLPDAVFPHFSDLVDWIIADGA